MNAPHLHALSIRYAAAPRFGMSGSFHSLWASLIESLRPGRTGAPRSVDRLASVDFLALTPDLVSEAMLARRG